MDIETFEEKNKVVPYLIVFKKKDLFHSFFLNGQDSDIISLFLNEIEIISQGEKVIHVFTHNINFDGFILIEYFLKKNIPYKWFLRNLNLYYIDFTYKGLDIKIRCSYKILGVSVNFLGLIFNSAKQVFPHKFVNRETIFYEGATPDSSFFNNYDDYLCFLDKWGIKIKLKNISLEYCKQDVEIVHRSLTELFKISNSNFLKNSFSFSSYSYKLFKKKYDNKKISNSYLDLSKRNYVENAYFGGRTEIFGNTVDGLIHRFDFPGMYGSCMKEKFAYGEPFFCKPENFKNPGFYTVTVKSNLKIPILPVRTKDKKIIFPNGIFTTCLERDEFLLFIEKGGQIIKIHNALLFPKEDYVFKEFVENFEKIKEKGGFHKLYGKQVINSLYGSFALKKEDVRYVILYDEKELNFLQLESRIKSFLKFDKMIIACVYIKESLNPRENRNISYSAFISSKARIKLHKNIYAIDDYYSKVYKEKYKLLYLETDSIDISLPKSHLGEKIMDVTWQKIYTKGVFISPKFYFLKEDLKSKIKGINDSKYEFDEIISFFYENKENLLFESQLQFEKKNFSLMQKYVDKTLKISSYDKRIFSKDKLSTTALEIFE